jgi:phosphatidylserine/phosphatidylglycerophosphate/cardiolipin synthase-like enzyme
MASAKKPFGQQISLFRQRGGALRMSEALRLGINRKTVVVDDEAVFITSANLTEAALDSNIELGLLVRDRALAASVSTHFRALIDQRLLLAMPDE